MTLYNSISSSFNLHLQQSLDQQRAAAHPKHHAWVSASAGTGKTKVLTDRILSLLLNGAHPRKILCLTFTNAASAEMMQRLLDRLGHWASCNDSLLSSDLQKLLNTSPTPSLLKHARTLFAEIIEMPSGFRIQTIHSFCQGLLASFPLEAQISLGTVIMTDHIRTSLVNQVQEAVLKDSLHLEDLQKDTTLLAEQFHSKTFQQLCDRLIQDRLQLMQVLSEGLKQAQIATLSTLKLDERVQNPDLLFKEMEEVDQNRQNCLFRIASLLQKGSVTDQKRGEAILHWLQQPKTRESFENYALHFLTREGFLRQKLVTQNLLNACPELDRDLRQEAEYLQKIMQNLKKQKIAEVSLALLHLGHRLLYHYESFKAERQVLDYNDLILKTSELLNHNDLGSWVLYKLDGGIDHLLVDEAQDTNQLQWSIITALTSEFFSGDGAQSQDRTLFVVGDGKQSIYGFQGTDPEIFSQMRTYFARLSILFHNNWQHLSMNLSFRSTSAILEFVDHLFSFNSTGEGVCDDLPSKHLCFRTHHEGHVEIWPLLTPEEGKNNSQNQHSKFSLDRNNLSVALAQQIATRIEKWLQKADIVPSRGRPLRGDDILILVRKRTSVVPALIQALKARGIAVSGLDRLKLLDELVVQDLMALAEFLLLPEDDFSLACVLKSPFGGLKEEDLFFLATTRGSKTLWQTLKDHQHHDLFKGIFTSLTHLLSQVDFVSPFALYSDILFHHQGMQKIIARFGEECVDPVEEFLSLAYDYQHQTTHSLQSFLHWLRLSDIEIKRDFSQKDTGEIRIMTVHGAKGLQAPIVILADTVSKPTWKESFLWKDVQESTSGKPTFLWSPSQAYEIETTRDLKEQIKKLQDQEYRRLLYVAVTRAEDQLYICGAHHTSCSPEGSWYHLIETSMAAKFQKTLLPTGEGYQWFSPSTQHTQQNLPESAIAVHSKLQSFSFEEEPSWLFKQESSQEKMPEKIILGSDPLFFHDLQGTNIHKLMRLWLKNIASLPLELEVDNCSHFEMSSSDYYKLYQHILKLKELLSLQNFFQKTCRTDVSITGMSEGRTYKIIVDRFRISSTDIEIIEYCPYIYQASKKLSRAQLQRFKIYLKLLQTLYPDHQLKIQILWLQEGFLQDVLSSIKEPSLIREAG